MRARLRALTLPLFVLLSTGCVADKSETSSGETSAAEGTGTGTGTSTGTAAEPTSSGTTAEPTSSGSSTGAAPAGCDVDYPRVRITTSMGDMVVMLDAVNIPITTANFIKYVEAEFYAGTIFHRVIDGFVIQGGGYTPDLQEKPTDPPIPLEIVPGAKHVDGAIAMARTDVKDSATAQFYICDGAQPGLDGDYAVFGVLVEGFDVLHAISAVTVDANDTPVTDVVIVSATCE